MLCELVIDNLAVIEHQKITFGKGLNVLSGETGSGKSIILHALELVLGARPRSSIIREGAESAEVSALFDLETLSDSCRQELPDIARADELVIVRSLLPSGRGKIYINGRIGTSALLEEIVSRLVNICGQGQQARLLDPRYHLELLDGYAAAESHAHASKLRERVAEEFESWRALNRQLEQLRESHQHAAVLLAQAEEVIADLGALTLEPGRRELLEKQVKQQRSSEALLRGVQEFSDILSSEVGLHSVLSRAIQRAAEISKLAPELRDTLQPLSSFKQALLEMERELARQAGKYGLDPQQLELLQDELAELARLERKYKTDSAGLCQKLAQAKQQLNALEGRAALNELERRERAAQATCYASARELSTLRREAGARLMKQSQAELAEVNMAGARLALNWVESALSASGMDSVELMIAANGGEGLHPLRKVASGGELSRLMLVLKNVLQERTGVNVLVFDEVDTGISGSVARAVGEKLKRLAAHSQVLCITHLAQVASLADHHLLVSKKAPEKQSKSLTRASVEVLRGEQRVDEVARMLAGYNITDASRASARELISSS
jgi:DNA repair protein RecN (Recombination protein N)